MPTTCASRWPANEPPSGCSTGSRPSWSNGSISGVNRERSGVARATVRGLLGFGFHRSGGRVRMRLEHRTNTRLKARLRRLTSRHWRVAMAVRLAALNRFIGGWAAYFALAETPSVFAELNEWLRRRLRQVRWKEALRRPAAQPARPRYPGLEGTPVGGQPEGLLVTRGFRSAPGADLQPLLDRSRSGIDQRSASRVSGISGEPPDADPHVR